MGSAENKLQRVHGDEGTRQPWGSIFFRRFLYGLLFCNIFHMVLKFLVVSGGTWPKGISYIGFQVHSLQL